MGSIRYIVNIPKKTYTGIKKSVRYVARKTSKTVKKIVKKRKPTKKSAECASDEPESFKIQNTKEEKNIPQNISSLGEVSAVNASQSEALQANETTEVSDIVPAETEQVRAAEQSGELVDAAQPEEPAVKAVDATHSESVDEIRIEAEIAEGSEQQTMEKHPNGAQVQIQQETVRVFVPRKSDICILLKSVRRAIRHANPRTLDVFAPIVLLFTIKSNNIEMSEHMKMAEQNYHKAVNADNNSATRQINSTRSHTLLMSAIEADDYIKLWMNNWIEFGWCYDALCMSVMESMPKDDNVMRNRAGIMLYAAVLNQIREHTISELRRLDDDTEEIVITKTVIVDAKVNNNDDVSIGTDEAPVDTDVLAKSEVLADAVANEVSEAVVETKVVAIDVVELINTEVAAEDKTVSEVAEIEVDAPNDNPISTVVSEEIVIDLSKDLVNNEEVSKNEIDKNESEIVHRLARRERRSCIEPEEKAEKAEEQPADKLAEKSGKKASEPAAIDAFNLPEISADEIMRRQRSMKKEGKEQKQPSTGTSKKLQRYAAKKLRNRNRNRN
ncbi:hypothetical protein NEMIN01_1091 [Nematocida minor]|uniref:uncharacterized protein n=1 Tax=Nematocida minor TaxID=1912983 RepID=UPI0022205E16|nr:uncharacterized protein NEMIN01_1091 [Nematocida minor]KAI5190553.1 hypothetical protein NEMIN01_1091 [Nematocida minor]